MRTSRTFGMAMMAAAVSSLSVAFGGRPLDLHDETPLLPAIGPIKSSRNSRPVKDYHAKRFQRGYKPHQGPREIARRQRQMEAGQIAFIKHGPREAAAA